MESTNHIYEWEEKQEFNLFIEFIKKHVAVEFNDYNFEYVSEVDDGIGGHCYRVALTRDDSNLEFPLYWPKNES